MDKTTKMLPTVAPTDAIAKRLLRFFVASVLVLPLNLVFLGYSFNFGTDGVSMAAINYGGDFVNYWSGGHLAAASQVMMLYDIATYKAWLGSYFAPEMSSAVFSYPPNMPVLLMPIGLLPHSYALLLWTVLGVTGYWFVCFYRTAMAGSWLSYALVASSSVVLFNISFGQLGLFLALGFVGALRLLPNRPVIAGVVLGLLTIKPQLGPLLILVLLMRREWSAVLTAVITALALAGTSVLLWGTEPWFAYINTILPYQVKLLETMNGFYARMMVTPYGGFYALGAAPHLALLLQGIVAIAVAITSLFMLHRDDVPWSLQVVTIAFGTSLLTPYMLAYDLAIPLAAVIWHFSEQDVRLRNWELWIVLALWALCFSVGITVQVMGFPLLPILMMLVFAVLLRQVFQFGKA